MSFNRKMILKHWRISISWISKTERGIVSKGGVKYFTNLSSSTMARQGTGQPLCDPPDVNIFLILVCLVYNFVSLPLTFPLLFPPPPPVSIKYKFSCHVDPGGDNPVLTVVHPQEGHVSSIPYYSDLLSRSKLVACPSSSRKKRDILLSINARKVYQYDWWSPEQLHKHHQHLVYDQARLRYR